MLADSQVFDEAGTSCTCECMHAIIGNLLIHQFIHLVWYVIIVNSEKLMLYMTNVVYGSRNTCNYEHGIGNHWY